MKLEVAPVINLPQNVLTNPNISNAFGFKVERIEIAPHVHPHLNFTLKVLDGLSFPGLPASWKSVPPVVREPAFWGNLLFFITCEYGVSLLVNGGQAMWAEKFLVSLAWGGALACLPTAAGKLVRRIWASKLVMLRSFQSVQPAAAFASIGQICMGCWESAPAGWLLCDGRAVSRSDYSQLFEVIKTVYGGGDGQHTFNIPDLQGRFALGRGRAESDSENFMLGDKGGHAQHVLSEAEMPRHSHGIHDPGHAHNIEAGGRKFTANGGKDSAFGVTLLGNPGNPQEGCGTGLSQVAHSNICLHEAGASAPHNNMPPYMVVSYCIKF